MNPRPAASAALLALIGAFLVPVPAGASASTTPPDLGLPAEVLSDLSATEGAALAALVSPEDSGETITVLTGSGDDLEATLVSATADNAQAAASILDAQPSVQVASVAQPVELSAPDPLRSAQWALTTLRAEEVRPLQGTTRPVVAVLDTGVDGTHEDLDDVLVPGYDVVGSTAGIVDLNGHGTHVAGIIGAEVDNGLGVSGLLSNVSIMPVRVMQTNSGNTGWTTQGVIWAADNGADVINLSLGGPGHDPALEAAVNYADAKGVVVVAAMGNAARDPQAPGYNATTYPAAYENVLAVGATDRNDVRGDFSNFGPHIDVAAPGVSIPSTWPSNTEQPSGSYAYQSGTSMASPYAAAVAAVTSARYPALSALQVRNHVKATATDKGTPGTDNYYGTGIVNPHAALTTNPGTVAPDAVPSAPRNVVSVPANAAATITWDTPTSAGSGGPVTGYQVTLTPTSGPARTADTNSSTRTATLTGLTNGTTYSVAVRASNGAGAGPLAFGSVTPRTVPGTVGGVTTNRGDGSVSLSWGAPGSTGGSPVTGYTLTAARSGAATLSATSTSSNYTFTGLTNGAAYTFTIAAQNAAGTGATTTAYALPQGAPGAVRTLYVEGARNGLFVRWDTPATDGGSNVTSYDVNVVGEATDVTQNVVGAYDRFVGGLAEGTSYQVRVRAVNALGNGPWSPSMTATTTSPARVSVPSAPTAPSLSPNPNLLSASWDAPDDDGGDPVTGYRVTLTPTGGTPVVVETGYTSHIFSGLLNGTSYRMTVQARNSTGLSAPTAAVTGTPRTLPAKVVVTSTTPGPGTLGVSWAVPDNGGATITGYVVTLTPLGGLPVVVETPGTSHTFTGLANGIPHQILVQARNAAGLSTFSTPASGTPHVVAPLTGDEAFVRALYLDMLGREPSSGEIAGWVTEVRSRGRGHVAGGFAGSREYRIKSINAAYLDVLKRPADPAGLEGWYQDVLKGRTSLDNIRPSFLASQEFYMQGGNTDAGWITLLYQRALGRNPSEADIAHWRGVMAREGRPSVIQGIYNSPESAGTRVDRAYRTWLGRSAGPSERVYWTSTVVSQGDEAMRQAVMVSLEYYYRSAAR